MDNNLYIMLVYSFIQSFTLLLIKIWGMMDTDRVSKKRVKPHLETFRSQMYTLYDIVYILIYKACSIQLYSLCYAVYQDRGMIVVCSRWFSELPTRALPGLAERGGL